MINAGNCLATTTVGRLSILRWSEHLYPWVPIDGMGSALDYSLLDLAVFNSKPFSIVAEVALRRSISRYYLSDYQPLR